MAPLAAAKQAARNPPADDRSDSPLPPRMSSAAHVKYVKSLYRRSLKLAESWYWQRAEFREMSVKIRALFDAGRDISNPHEIRAALMNTERILAANVHPTPFIQPTGYGGTKYERNVPVPEEVLRRGVVPVDNYQ